MYEKLADFFENGSLGRYSDTFKYYGKSLRKWNDFGGRTNLHEFLLTMTVASLCTTIITFIVTIIAGLIGGLFTIFHNDILTQIGGLIATLIIAATMIFFMIPSLSLIFRRLHDTNRSALWLLTLLCCGLGIIPLYIFMIGNSVDQDNKYGDSDKEFNYNQESYQSNITGNDLGDSFDI